MAGNPKKGGHGGKFTWHGGKGPDLGDIDDALDSSADLDADDPNYDSDDAYMLLPRGHAEELQTYKKRVGLSPCTALRSCSAQLADRCQWLCR